MIAIATLLIGALIGALTAKRKGGNTLDAVQYGAVFALIGFILGLVGTVVLERVIL